jgi:hypothetical protein
MVDSMTATATRAKPTRQIPEDHPHEAEIPFLPQKTGGAHLDQGDTLKAAGRRPAVLLSCRIMRDRQAPAITAHSLVARSLPRAAGNHGI